MKRRLLLGYQLLTGLSDTVTGLLLIATPMLTTRVMGLHVPEVALVFLSYVGVFVLSVGVAGFYGAYLVLRRDSAARLETVWLLTALTRALVAIFVTARVATGTFEAGWMMVAATDGAFALVQTAGLLRGWLRDI